MSLFVSAHLSCPVCDTQVPFERISSVNGARKPHQREAILDRTFQVGTCTCGMRFRMQPDFVYLDVPRGQWFAVFPSEQLYHWQEAENRGFDAFDLTFGTRASPAVRSVGRTLRPRVVFGWEGLREKLVADELGFDDRVLEVVKLLLHREYPDILTLDGTFRLVDVEEDTLQLAWLRIDDEVPLETVTVPASVLEVDLEAPRWTSLRKELEIGYFVDAQRLYRAPLGR